jgi:NAD(P)-dependent dehydrogenase (short-subunit alcohol dehydrogenase family)
MYRLRPEHQTKWAPRAGGFVDVRDKIAVVTGGASGIGYALAKRFVDRGARGVVIADIDGERAEKVSPPIGALGVACDVGDPDSIRACVAQAEAAFGPVDIFVSNAGYSDPAPGDLSLEPAAFRRIVDVNLLAHVWAAQAVIPGMVERGGGYLVQTISSAALITGPSAPGYTLTKHGALGFAEWVTLNYGHLGIRVSCLCPNAVLTGMFGAPPDQIDVAPPADHPIGEILRPIDVADAVIEAMAEERFLILPHPRVGESFLRKATDYQGWIDGTRRRLLRMRGIDPAGGPVG